MKVYSTRTTYAPNGEVLAEPTPLILVEWNSTESAIESMIRLYGFSRDGDNQISKVDRLGFRTVVTYSEEMQNE